MATLNGSGIGTGSVSGAEAPVRIGIVAPSSVISPIELKMGVAKLESAGFHVKVDPQVKLRHWFFAGEDAERAEALHAMALDPEIDVVWCGRGGYGAIRLLQNLDELTRKKKPQPGKLLVGYSDATILHEYVRKNWGWRTLHAPMPGVRQFLNQTDVEWNALAGLVRGDRPVIHWEKTRLQIAHAAGLGAGVTAELVGGNLCVLASMVGTPWMPDLRGKMLFLEEIDESLYRVDRLLQQLVLSGSLRGIKAIILGEFPGCEDTIAKGLKKPLKDVSKAKPGDFKPLRPALVASKLIPEIFSQVGREYGIPVVHTLPVGHGDGLAPLPLGVRYRLGPDGMLKLLSWN